MFHLLNTFSLFSFWWLKVEKHIRSSKKIVSNKEWCVKIPFVGKKTQQTDKSSTTKLCYLYQLSNQNPSKHRSVSNKKKVSLYYFLVYAVCRKEEATRNTRYQDGLMLRAFQRLFLSLAENSFTQRTIQLTFKKLENTCWGSSF